MPKDKGNDISIHAKHLDCRAEPKQVVATGVTMWRLGVVTAGLGVGDQNDSAEVGDDRMGLGPE